MPKKYIHALLIGVVFSVSFSLLFYLHYFESWQLRFSDSFFQSRPPNKNIAIIAIDDRSIQAIGRWPWDRSVHAKLIEYLGNVPKVIGYDVSFPEPSKDQKQDEILRLALAKTGNVVLPITAKSPQVGEKEVFIKDELWPIQQFAEVADAGLVNQHTDVDNITRQTDFTISALDNKNVENFSEKILKRYLQQTQLPFVPTDHGLLRINFVGKPGTFPVFSFIDVLNKNVSLDEFLNKIVFVGSTASDLHDNLSTPVSRGVPMSGVEVHANIIQTILERKFLYTDSQLVTILTIFVLCIICSLLFAWLGIIPSIFILFGIVFSYIIYTIFSFDNGFIRNIVYPALSILTVFVAQLVYKYFVENKQKRFIKKALSYYLSESVMQEVLSHPGKLTLGGSRKEITVLFSDIAGFTSISEKIPPETLAHLLNQYLTRMTNIVFNQSGVLDKYIGDAVMAFWGAPLDENKHALLACTAALKMREEIERIKQDWKKFGIDDFDVRIGINTGDMIVGNMGSDLRFNYTLLGDNVNLGSRLEGINKEYKTHVIISGSTYEQVKDEVIARPLDIVAVKGKAKGVSIFELRGLGQALGKEKEFLDKFEKARQFYHFGNFKKALFEFKEIYKHSSHDGPTKIYIKRCEEYIELPPEKWDGVYHATAK